VDYNSDGVKIKADWDTSLPADVIKSTGILGNTALADKGENATAYAGRANVRIVPCVCEDTCDDEEEKQAYIREMYNFIADIVDEVNGCGRALQAPVGIRPGLFYCTPGRT
jgi:hypothetical protein